MVKNRNGGLTDEEISRETGGLIASLAKDPTILESIFALLPQLDKMQDAHQRHRNILNEVLGGATEKEGDLEAARNEVITHASLVHGLAQLTGKHDPTIPQKLGVASPPTSSKRVSSTNLSQMNFRVVYQEHQLVARANGVKGAKSYEVSVCEGDPATESNWRHQATSTRANRIVLTGLTAGKVYYFRIRAITSHGEGPWSNFVSIMAI